MRRSLRPEGRHPRGQTLAEFALVLPIVILLILALFDLGRGVFLYNGLMNAAHEGARLAIVNQDTALIGERVQTMALTASVSNLGGPDLVRFYKVRPNNDPTTNPQCTTLAVGCIAVVIAKADWQPITPIIGSLIGPIQFRGQAEIPIEFVCPNPRIAAYATSDTCPRQP